MKGVHEGGRMQSVYVTGPLQNQTYIIAHSNILLPTGLQNWGQNYKEDPITIIGKASYSEIMTSKHVLRQVYRIVQALGIIIAF